MRERERERLRQIQSHTERLADRHNYKDIRTGRQQILQHRLAKTACFVPWLEVAPRA